MEWVAALGLISISLTAQESNQVEQLRLQIKQLQENFEKQQQVQRQQIDALMRRIDVLNGTNASSLKVGSNATTAPNVLEWTERPWWSINPLRIGDHHASMDIGLNASFAAGGSTANDLSTLQSGGHDPSRGGFNMQVLELTLNGNVDHFFRASASLHLPQSGSVETEEAYIESLSLPGGLQLRAGQFITEFGRQNPMHLHNWSFVDSPLVSQRMFGADGMRGLGTRVSWLVPTPFYSELFLTVQNDEGETMHSFRKQLDTGKTLFGRSLDYTSPSKSLNQLAYTPRYAAAFDLTDTQTLLLGVSAALGNNSSGPSTRSRIYGGDLTWKWKPANHSGGYPFVQWQTEGLYREYEAGAVSGLNAETLKDYGIYSQISYGFTKGWVAGLRWDYVDRTDMATSLGGTNSYDDAERARRWRLSPNLTWDLSENSKLRLQYNYDQRAGLGADHTVWLQFVFSLGAHHAHSF